MVAQRRDRRAGAEPAGTPVTVRGGRPRTCGADAIDQTVVCATGPDPIVAAIDKFVGAGFDTVYLHQIGPDQERLADLARHELLPHYS